MALATYAPNVVPAANAPIIALTPIEEQIYIADPNIGLRILPSASSASGLQDRKADTPLVLINSTRPTYVAEGGPLGAPSSDFNDAGSTIIATPKATPLIPATGSITMCAVAKTRNSAETVFQALFANTLNEGPTSGALEFFFGWRADSRTLYLRMHGGNQLAFDTGVVGQWMSLALALDMDEKTAAIFLNKVLVASGTFTTVPNNLNLLIGGNGNYPGDPNAGSRLNLGFRGDIANVTIYPGVNFNKPEGQASKAKWDAYVKTVFGLGAD